MDLGCVVFHVAYHFYMGIQNVLEILPSVNNFNLENILHGAYLFCVGFLNTIIFEILLSMNKLILDDLSS